MIERFRELAANQSRDKTRWQDGDSALVSLKAEVKHAHGYPQTRIVWWWHGFIGATQ
ncbi:MAG: hypothetical protein R3C24_06310 [Cyanobacteriota/Melainabacteria group bacterium]